MAPSSMDPRSIGLLTALKSAFADTDLPLGAPRAMSSCDEHNSRGQSPTPRLTKPSQPVPTRLPGALMHGSCMANASATVATPYAPYARARSSRAVLGRNATGPIVTGPAAAGHALPEVEPSHDFSIKSWHCKNSFCEPIRVGGWVSKERPLAVNTVEI